MIEHGYIAEREKELDPVTASTIRYTVIPPQYFDALGKNILCQVVDQLHVT